MRAATPVDGCSKRRPARLALVDISNTCSNSGARRIFDLDKVGGRLVVR
jgi:hypothetical protein